MIAGRDPEAFRALYRAHYRTVCRYLAARTERDLVEDVAAETFLVAERLARTPENERLRRMSPHPAAKQVVEGRW